jgi:hypothetical protein
MVLVEHAQGRSRSSRPSQANVFALLLLALLEKGEPMTLAEVAARFEKAGVADAGRIAT